MWLWVSILTCQRNTDDYYNAIDLNYIFNDNGILDEWIQEEEQQILPPEDLDWLNEGIRHSDESGCDGSDDDDGDGDNDEETCGIGESQRASAMSWNSDYYTTQDTDHRGWSEISQHRHLDRLVELSSSDDYSSEHDNNSQGYHSLEGHLSGLGLTSDQNYGGYYDHARQRHNDHD